GFALNCSTWNIRSDGARGRLISPPLAARSKARTGLAQRDHQSGAKLFHVEHPADGARQCIRARTSACPMPAGAPPDGPATESTDSGNVLSDAPSEPVALSLPRPIPCRLRLLLCLPRRAEPCHELSARGGNGGGASGRPREL